MPRTLRWRNLTGGLLALAGVVATALAVLFFGRVGALHGDTFRLYLRTSQARGLMKGSEVWLAGLKVGLVSHVEFLPVTTDTAERLVVAFDVLAPYLGHIRRDSYAQIRSGSTLIGAPVVWITPGTPAAPALGEDDTLRAIAQSDFEGITSRVALASQEFPVIITNIKTLSAQLNSAEGTLGALTGEDAPPQLDALRANVGHLTSVTFAGRGTLGRVVADTALAARVQRAVARADSIGALLSSDRTSLGRFRRDSTLAAAVSDVRDEVSIVRALLDEPRGSAGRAVRDRAVAQQLARLDVELGRLIADIKRRPLRYVNF